MWVLILVPVLGGRGNSRVLAETWEVFWEGTWTSLFLPSFILPPMGLLLWCLWESHDYYFLQTGNQDNRVVWQHSSFPESCSFSFFCQKEESLSVSPPLSSSISCCGMARGEEQLRLHQYRSSSHILEIFPSQQKRWSPPVLIFNLIPLPMIPFVISLSVPYAYLGEIQKSTERSMWWESVLSGVHIR